MTEAQAELAGTLHRTQNGAVDKKGHRHRWGTVLRVDNTKPICDVMLDPGDQVNGVAYYGTAPKIGDPVEVLIEPSAKMRVTANRRGKVNITEVIGTTTDGSSPADPVVERIFGNEVNSDGTSDLPPAAIEWLGWAFEALDTGREFVCNGESWVQISAGIADPPRLHGPEAHTDEVGTGTGDTTDTQGDPTSLYWCETEVDLPPATTALRRSFAVVLATDVDSPALEVCNGESWDAIAYLNASPRVHGPEAHVASGLTAVDQTVQVTKLVDEPYTSTTPRDDGLQPAALAFPVNANEVWWWELCLFFDGTATNGQGDLSWTMVGPTGTTGRYGYNVGPDASSVGGTAPNYVIRINTSTDYTGANPLNLGTIGTGSSALVVPVRAWGLAQVAGLGGVVKLRASQRQTSATATTIKLGSALMARRLV